MSKILIVSELFYPDKTSTAHILTQIADYLSENHDIKVICSNSSYSSTDCSGSDADKPYPVERIASGKYNKNNLLSRAYNLVRNSCRLISAVRRNVTEGDDVFIVTNPAPMLLLTALLKKFRQFRLTILVHDVFPENTIAAGVVKNSKSLSYRILLSIFNRAYSKADNLVVLGRDMRQVVESKVSSAHKRPQVHIVENWADECDCPLAETPHDAISILYAGNIGRCQGLENFMEVFSSSENRALRFVIRGSGAIEDKLKSTVAEKGLENVDFGGPYSRDGQFEVLSGCDLALITLADGMFGLGVPSKAYNILAAGKPILYIGDENSEVALMIKEYELGYCFSPSDHAGIKRWLDSLSIEKKKEFEEMGSRARQLALTRYSRTEILKKFQPIFS